jgi:hypothetical protein
MSVQNTRSESAPSDAPQTSSIYRPTPSLADLITGVPFVSSSPKGDARALATWLLERLSEDCVHDRLRETLDWVNTTSDSRDMGAAAAACRALQKIDGMDEAELSEIGDIFDFLAACSGCQVAAQRVALRAIRMVDFESNADDEALDILIAALGWLGFAAQPNAEEWLMVRSHAEAAGERLFDCVVRAWRARIGDLKPEVARQAEPIHTSPFDEPEESDPAETDPRERGIVVVRSVGNAETPEGKKVVAAFRSLVGEDLPRVSVPDLRVANHQLISSYPHAEPVIRSILGMLVGRDHVALPPIIFVGPPGCGKTSLATDLLRVLCVPVTVYPCGGATDASLGGTPRRWSTGEPSLPVSLMATHMVSSPGIILDEIEKAGTGTQNGRVQDVLLGMLEPKTSRCWQDPYLEAAVDISHIVWIATANSIQDIPNPLRDRCRILSIPAPGVSHLSGLAQAMLRTACLERGLDSRWAFALDGEERQALATAWTGGSLRGLRKMVDCVLAARDHSFSAH